ncbi:hypothetical protein [Streptomyces telluris]|uniref:Lipoprotein n=1 Tax=Streptomyces telluris TaxID=2720021 RepID=A0A9X2LM50_9ACTN|nr:hypothetical protein [Streptomyces telluris]MCQ8773762.1 hypothetical protein [Streptomyces telluris]NJP77081.1 hypothetical protein [Streptomyces telluris]
MRRVAAVAVAAASVLAVAGCSSSGDGKKDGGTRGNPGVTKEEHERADAEARERAKDEAAMKDAAVRYTKAYVAHDVRTMCSLMTPTKRGGDGSLDGCVKHFEELGNGKPGSEVTVSVEGSPVDVSPIGKHPQGTGLMVKQTTGAEASVRRQAMRMVKADGAWLVDQKVTVRDEDMSAGNPVRNVLMRSPE